MRQLIILSCCLALLGSPAFGEFSCRANIGYKWKRVSKPVDPAKGDKNAPPPADEGKEIDSILKGVERSGADEAGAKAALAAVLESEKLEALHKCRQDHEDLAGCIARKFSQLGPIGQGMDFKARKVLDDAINADCSGQQGTCLSGMATEPQCAEKITAAGGEKKDEGKDDKAKKDDKGKGKKK